MYYNYAIQTYVCIFNYMYNALHILYNSIYIYVYIILVPRSIFGTYTFKYYRYTPEYAI